MLNQEFCSGTYVFRYSKTQHRSHAGKLPGAVEDVERGGQASPPPLIVTNIGPSFIADGVKLLGIRLSECVSYEHYTLLCLGASINKSVCDGSHWQIKFEDEKSNRLAGLKERLVRAVG